MHHRIDKSKSYLVCQLAWLVMELRQLEYLVAVAEEASFTRAAARLHVAQPGVSAQIRQLERELGQPLLDRSARGVHLTEAGEAVLPYARAALAGVAGARAAVDEVTGLVRGHLSLGMVTSISTGEIDLPGLLTAFRRDHPGVDISLTVGSSDDLVAQLRAGRLDLGVIGLGPHLPRTIDTHTVAAAPLVAAVAHDDPLAARSTITLSTLVRRPLISLPHGTGLRACLDEACAAAGLTPHVAFEASDPPFLAQLAACGLGVAIVPAGVAGAHRDTVHAIAITRPTLQGRLALAWRAEGPASPATRALLTRARAAWPDPTAEPATGDDTGGTRRPTPRP